MKINLVLMAIASTVFSSSVIADNHGNTMPPPGPYRSITDVGQHEVVQNLQNQPRGGRMQGYLPVESNRVPPDWTRQQGRMGSRMNQSNIPQQKNWGNQSPQWEYNQRPSMPGAYSGQMPALQNNRMQRPFPSARGSVYGPGMPPADYYGQPMQQTPRY